MAKQAVSLAPPSAPWQPVSTNQGAGAYVSVYLSSPLARLPVRDVLRLDDNKSDPNLETFTYGLFSTCEPTMRRSIASRGIGEIFFVTAVEGIGRAVVGWYELGWVAEVDAKDFAFAAQRARFFDPVAVGQIMGKAGRELQRPLRNYKIVDQQIADDLRSLVDASDDRTADYLFEIDRLERMSLSRTGYRYPSWDRVDPFSWDAATPYLADTDDASAGPNTSSSGAWVCSKCASLIRNEARLKVCNVCQSRGTLGPAQVSA